MCSQFFYLPILPVKCSWYFTHQIRDFVKTCSICTFSLVMFCFSDLVICHWVFLCNILRKEKLSVKTQWNIRIFSVMLPLWFFFWCSFFNFWLYGGLVGEGFANESKGSNPTRRVAWLRDPNLLQGSLWPSDQIVNMQW